jgi:alpha-methylacyl-CoA racemase
MSGGAFSGCGIYESADGHVALSAVEPHFFERALRAFGVDGCHDASRGVFVGKTACELEAVAAQADIP